MHQCPNNFLFLALMLFNTSRAFASVPPDHKEPTRAEMRAMGFKYKIQKDDASSTIDLRFPKKVHSGRFALVPHITDVVVKNSAGEEIAKTTNWIADNELMSVVTSYDHKVSDLSVSITYACARRGNSGCYGATTVNIPSLSKFIDANPDLVNLRPKCRKVTSTINDCTKYENAEYP
jgi:hypothetical protein